MTVPKAGLQKICRDYLALLQRMVAQKGALLAHRRRFREGRPYRY